MNARRSPGSVLASTVIEDWSITREQADRAADARVGVITFPGPSTTSTPPAPRRIGGGRVRSTWQHADDTDLKGVDAVVVPGGFSYGDYLRCGAIAKFAPVMTEVIAAAGRGMPVLGICNGFQILCEAGLLPGALARNAGTALHLP